MIEVIDALLDLVEPQGSPVTIDRSCSQPNDYVVEREGALYAWPVTWQDVRVGSGSVDDDGEIEFRFAVRLVFVLPNVGEVADLQRSRELSEKLEAKARAYLAAIHARDAVPPWDNLTATVDWDFIRQLELRGVSIVATGYRLGS